LPHPDHPNDRSLFIGAEPGQNLGQKQLEDLVSFFLPENNKEHYGK
jgi:hypothetical protein